ncbi:MAG: branched-chain amino acid ABC transporter permease [Thermoplasmata archaeon]
MADRAEESPGGTGETGEDTTESVADFPAGRLSRLGGLLYRHRVILGSFGLVLMTGTILAALLGGNLAQALVSGVVIGSIYVLGATGLSLIYAIKKFANFAHGDLLTLGAYMVFFVNVGVGLNIFFGFVIAIVGMAFVGILLEILIFRHLEGRGAIAPLIASVGVFIIIQNGISAAFGTTPDFYNVARLPNLFFGDPVLVQINPIKGVLTFVVAVGATVMLHILLSRTTLGKSMRAMADNPDLARASGINTRNVTLWTWAISGMLAGLAGGLLALSLDVRPLLGFGILLFLFAAVIIGGIGSPYGAMVGGFLVGLIQSLSGILLEWLGRADTFGLESASAYRPMAAFLAMIAVLLVKPEGLMGRAGTAGGRGAGLLTRLRRR